MTSLLCALWSLSDSMADIPSIIILSPMFLLLMVVMIPRRFAPIDVGGPTAL